MGWKRKECRRKRGGVCDCLMAVEGCRLAGGRTKSIHVNPTVIAADSVLITRM